jgi:hypothetical protein
MEEDILGFMRWTPESLEATAEIADDTARH